MHRLGRLGRRAAAAAIIGGLLAVPAVAGARPADVNVVNTPTVGIDPFSNTIQLGGLPTVNAAQGLYAATVKITPASTDTQTCLQVPLPASGAMLLQSVLVTDYFSPTVPIAYIKPFIKTGSATGQVLQMRIPLTVSQPDPTSNVRTGLLVMPLDVAGGGFSNAVVGQAYDMYACISHVNGESAQANYVFTGTTTPSALASAPTTRRSDGAVRQGSLLRYGTR
jgi:hypothetical protein